MKSLETIAADLAEYIAARQNFLKKAADGSQALSMNAVQHREAARLLISAERIMRVLDNTTLTPGAEVDLVGVLDSFYVGLAHLAMAYDVRWVIQGKNDGKD